MKKNNSQEEGFLDNFLGPLIKVGWPLTKNILKPLANSALIPLGLTTAASVTNAGIQNKNYGFCMTALIISNKEMKDTMKIVKSLEEFGSLIKGFNEKIEIEAKEQKGGFLGMLLGIVCSTIPWNLLKCKGVTGAGEKTIRTGQDC